MTDKTYYAVVEFEDGLQVVPNNWLSIDLQSAVWPNFTNNKMYDKAVKLMKDPEPTWTRHLIKKIYGTYFQYAVAMKKLKDAEETSDLNSGTEREEYRKKSRKLRAAKVADSSSSNDDQSDASFLSDIPTIPTTATHVPKKIKIASSTSAQQNSAPKCLGKIKKQDDCSLQKHTNVKVFDGYLDCMTAVIDCNSNLDQHDTNLYHDFSNVGNNDNIETSNNDWIDNESLHSRFQPNFNENNTDITNSQRESIVNKTYTKVSQSYDEQKNFQRFVVGKIINLEIAMNDVKRNVKLILEKLSLDVTKEKENIDTLKDFPLKEQKDLDTVELKLQNNSDYRDEMIKQLARVRSGCMRTSCIRLMRLIFSNEIAIKYSWVGAKKKLNFSTLNLCKVIINVIRKSHADATDDEISAPIKIWLAHAKERMGRQNHNNHEHQDENQD